jgi:hypothetical protein
MFITQLSTRLFDRSEVNVEGSWIAERSLSSFGNWRNILSLTIPYVLRRTNDSTHESLYPNTLLWCRLIAVAKLYWPFGDLTELPSGFGFLAPGPGSIAGTTPMM